MFGTWKLRIIVLIVITCLLVDVLAHHKRRRSQRRSSIKTNSNSKNNNGNKGRNNVSEIPSKVRASKETILQLREVLLERIRQGDKSNIGVFIINGATRVVRGKARIRLLQKNHRLLTTTHVRRLVRVLEKRLQGYDRQQKPNKTESIGVIERSSGKNAQEITITRSIVQSTTSTMPSTKSALYVNQPIMPVTESTTHAQSRAEVPTSEFMLNQRTNIRSNVQAVNNIRPPTTNNEISGFINPVFSARGAWSGRNRVNTMARNFNNVRNNQRLRTQTNTNNFARSNMPPRQSNGRFMNAGNSRMSPSTIWRHSNSRTVQQQQQQMFQQQQRSSSRFSVNQQTSNRNQQSNTWSQRNLPFSQNRQSFSNHRRNQVRRPMFSTGRMSSVSRGSSRGAVPGINRNRSFQGRNQGSAGEFVVESQVIEVDNRGVPRIVERNGLNSNSHRNTQTRRNPQRFLQNSPRSMGNNRSGVRNPSASNASNLESKFTRFRTVTRRMTEPFSVAKKSQNIKSKSTENNKTVSSDLSKPPPKDVKQDIPNDLKLEIAIKTVEGYLATQNKSLTISKKSSKKKASSLVYPTIEGSLSLPPLTTTQRPAPQTSTQDSVSSLIKQLINKPRIEVTETDLKLIEEIKLLMKLNSNRGLVSDADMKLLNDIELLAKGMKDPKIAGITNKPPVSVTQPNLISPMINSVNSVNSAPPTLQNNVNQQGANDFDMLINAASGVLNNKQAPLSTNQQILGELEKILQIPSNTPTNVNVQQTSTRDANIATELNKLLQVNPSALNSVSLKANAPPGQFISPQSGTIHTQVISNSNKSGRTSQNEVNILKELGTILQNNGQNTPVIQQQNSNLLTTNVAQQNPLNQNLHQLQSVARGSMPPGVLPLGQTHSTQQQISSFQQVRNQGLGADIQQQQLLMARPMMANPMAQLMGLNPLMGPSAMMELMYGDTTDPPDPTDKPTVTSPTTIKPVVSTPKVPTTTARATTTVTMATTTPPVSHTTPLFKIPIKTLVQKINGMVEEKTKQLKQKQKMTIAKKNQNTANVPPPPVKHVVVQKEKVEQTITSKQNDQSTVLSKIQESIRKALEEAGIKQNIQLVVKPKERSNSEILQNTENSRNVRTERKTPTESKRRLIPQQRGSQTITRHQKVQIPEPNRVRQAQKDISQQRTDQYIKNNSSVQESTSRNVNWKEISDTHRLRDNRRWQAERKNLAFNDIQSENRNEIQSPGRNANPYDRHLQRNWNTSESKLETKQTSHIVNKNINGDFSNAKTNVIHTNAANNRFTDRDSVSHVSSNTNTPYNQNAISNTRTSVTHASNKLPILLRDAQKRRQFPKKNISSNVNEQIDKLKSVRDILSKSLPHNQYRNIVNTLESLIKPNTATATGNEKDNRNNQQIKSNIETGEKANFNVEHSDKISAQRKQRVGKKSKGQNSPLVGSEVKQNKHSFSTFRKIFDSRKDNKPLIPTTNRVSFTYNDPAPSKSNVQSVSSIRSKTLSGNRPSLPPSKELEFLLNDNRNTFKFPRAPPSPKSINTAQIDPGSLQDVRLSVSNVQHSDINSNNARNTEANEYQNLIGDLDSILQGRLVSRVTKDANKENGNNRAKQAAVLDIKTPRSNVDSAVLSQPETHLTISETVLDTKSDLLNRKNAGAISEKKQISYDVEANTQTGNSPFQVKTVDIKQKEANSGVSSKGIVNYGQMSNAKSLILHDNKEISFRALETPRKSPDFSITPPRMMSKETSKGTMLTEGTIKYDVRNQKQNTDLSQTQTKKNTVRLKVNEGKNAVNANPQTNLPTNNLQNSTALKSVLLKMVKKEVLKTVHGLQTSNSLRPTTGKPISSRQREEFEQLEKERIEIEARRTINRRTTTTHSPKLLELLWENPRTTTVSPGIAYDTTRLPRRRSTSPIYSNQISLCDPKYKRYHCTGKDLFLGITSIGPWCVGKCLKGRCVESVCNCSTTCERSGKVDMNEIIGNAIASAISGHSAVDGKAKGALQALLSSLETSNKELTVQISKNIQTTVNPELPLAVSKRSSLPPLTTSTERPQKKKSKDKSISDINALLSSIESLIDAKINGIVQVTPSPTSTSTIKTTTYVPRDAEGEIIELEDRLPAKKGSTSTTPATQPTLPQYYESSTRKQPAGMERFFDSVGRNKIDRDPRFRPTDGPWRDRSGSFRNRRPNGDWRRDSRDRHWDRSWRESPPTPPPTDSAWSTDRQWRDRPPPTDRSFRDRQRDPTVPPRDWGRRGPDFTPTRPPNERRFSDWRDRPPSDRGGGEWNTGFRRRRLNEYRERNYWGEHRGRRRGREDTEAAD